MQRWIRVRDNKCCPFLHTKNKAFSLATTISMCREAKSPSYFEHYKNNHRLSIGTVDYVSLDNLLSGGHEDRRKADIHNVQKKKETKIQAFFKIIFRQTKVTDRMTDCRTNKNTLTYNSRLTIHLIVSSIVSFTSQHRSSCVNVHIAQGGLSPFILTQRYNYHPLFRFFELTNIRDIIFVECVEKSTKLVCSLQNVCVSLIRFEKQTSQEECENWVIIHI